MNLGERIYKFRTAKNMSQGDLADALEVSRQSVSKWENGTAVPELDKIVKMAQVFGVSLDELVTGAEPAAPSEPQPPQPEIHTVYIEKQVPATFPAPKILGTALLLISLVLVILLVATEEMELMESILLLLPVMSIGFVCLVSAYPLVWSLWCGIGGYWLYLIMMSRRWEDQWFFMILGAVMVVLMLIFTARKQEKGELSIPAWVWIAGILLLLAAAALLIVNILPVDSSGMVSPAIPMG